MSDAPRPEDVTAADGGTATAPGDAPDTTEPAQAVDSTQATPEAPTPEGQRARVAEPGPTPEELADAVPAVVRHAPRFSRILLTGAGTPAAVGFLLGSLLPNAVTSGRVIAGLLVGLGFGIIGGVITGVYVVTADQRASKRADEERAALLAEQASQDDAEVQGGTASQDDAAVTDDPAASQADTTDQEETR